MIRAAVSNMRRYRDVPFSGAQDAEERNAKGSAAPSSPRLGSLASIGPQMQALLASRTAAPSSPAGPAASSVPLDPLRPDSIYNQRTSDINNALGVESVSGTADLNTLGQQYGIRFQTDVDPATGLQKLRGDSLAIDLSNPYSKASLLQKAYDQGQRATSGQLAGQGQLYSGYLQSKLEQGTGQFRQGQNDLFQGFSGAAGDVWRRGFEAWKAGQEGKTTAASDLLGRNTAREPEGPPAPPPGAPVQQTAQPTAQQMLLEDPSKPWHGKPLKWTANGLFYQRGSDKKWIPVKG